MFSIKFHFSAYVEMSLLVKILRIPGRLFDYILGEKRHGLEIARFYPADSFPSKIIAVLSIDRSAVY